MTSFDNQSIRIHEMQEARAGRYLRAFEVGMGSESHQVQRIGVDGAIFKCSPIGAGPVAADVDAPNGGTVRIFQADTLAALIAGNVRVETWTFTPAAREIRGIVPVRRFVVFVAEGDGIKTELRPLGMIRRGPSVLTLAPAVVNWGL